MINGSLSARVLAGDSRPCLKGSGIFHWNLNSNHVAGEQMIHNHIANSVGKGKCFHRGGISLSIYHGGKIRDRVENSHSRIQCLNTGYLIGCVITLHQYISANQCVQPSSRQGSAFCHLICRDTLRQPDPSCFWVPIIYAENDGGWGNGS